jgi:hypothetical protein
MPPHQICYSYLQQSAAKVLWGLVVAALVVLCTVHEKGFGNCALLAVNSEQMCSWRLLVSALMN